MAPARGDADDDANSETPADRRRSGGLADGTAHGYGALCAAGRSTGGHTGDEHGCVEAADDIIPGFAVPIAELFEDLD
jgi:hypothetical protein